MYSLRTFAVLIVALVNATIIYSARYTVVSQRTLKGWSYELANINRIGCLLACSRRIYCWSVNYSEQDRLCQINKEVKSSTDSFQQDFHFEYIEKVLDKDFKEHGVHFTSTGVTYEEAGSICRFNLGSLASYEQLYQAFQPRLDNCTEGWLISGEIAFTEISGDKCTLRSPEQRSNIFPNKYYHNDYYCYRRYSHQSSDDIPLTQRIIRLTYSDTRKLNATESETRCRMTGGRLATPFEVYNATYSLGVDLCRKGWHLGGIGGNPCTENIPSEFWLHPTANAIYLQDPAKTYFAMCFIPLPNENITFPDPYPPHRVLRVRGSSSYTLTYQDAKERCVSYGGTLATRAQLESAQLAGYDSCSAGWVEGGEVVYPITHPRPGCSNSPSVVSYGFLSQSSSTCDGYCQLY